MGSSSHEPSFITIPVLHVDTTDGSNVGRPVGSYVVGTSVGIFVGNSVGTFVGNVVGFSVGKSVGE